MPLVSHSATRKHPPTTPNFSTLPATAMFVIASLSGGDGIFLSIASGPQRRSASPADGAYIPSLLIEPDFHSTFQRSYRINMTLPIQVLPARAILSFRTPRWLPQSERSTLGRSAPFM